MNRRGFTLVELLVVMGIMALLLGIATLNFSRMTKKSTAENNVRELYATLKMAQMDSLRTYRRHAVAISANSYVLRRYSSAACRVSMMIFGGLASRARRISTSIPLCLGIIRSMISRSSGRGSENKAETSRGRFSASLYVGMTIRVFNTMLSRSGMINAVFYLLRRADGRAAWDFENARG